MNIDEPLLDRFVERLVSAKCGANQRLGQQQVRLSNLHVQRRNVFAKRVGRSCGYCELFPSIDLGVSPRCDIRETVFRNLVVPLNRC
jgi:hypothetical protein